MSIGVAILALAVLVLVHEAGHFFAAKAVGMKPGPSPALSQRG